MTRRGRRRARRIACSRRRPCATIAGFDVFDGFHVFEVFDLFDVFDVVSPAHRMLAAATVRDDSRICFL